MPCTFCARSYLPLPFSDIAGLGKGRARDVGRRDISMDNRIQHPNQIADRGEGH